MPSRLATKKPIVVCECGWSTMASETFELKYKEPFWSTLPPAGCVWALDVIRSGVELPRVPLEGKACFLIGRVPVCDIVLDNETVSRQHAVLQCRGNGKIYVSPTRVGAGEGADACAGVRPGLDIRNVCEPRAGGA